MLQEYLIKKFPNFKKEFLSELRFQHNFDDAKIGYSLHSIGNDIVVQVKNTILSLAFLKKDEVIELANKSDTVIHSSHLGSLENVKVLIENKDLTFNKIEVNKIKEIIKNNPFVKSEKPTEILPTKYFIYGGKAKKVVVIRFIEGIIYFNDIAFNEKPISSKNIDDFEVFLEQREFLKILKKFENGFSFSKGLMVNKDYLFFVDSNKMFYGFNLKCINIELKNSYWDEERLVYFQKWS